MGNALTIQARREPGYVVVTVAGEVDIATVAALRERLSALAAGGLPLVADLDQVSFIDATGLGALAAAARLAAARGVSLYVVCAQPQTRPSVSPGWTVRYPGPRPGRSAMPWSPARRETTARSPGTGLGPGRRPRRRFGCGT